MSEARDKTASYDGVRATGIDAASTGPLVTAAGTERAAEDDAPSGAFLDSNPSASAKLTVPAYASSVAEYAPSRAADQGGALVVAVTPESPADDAGIEPGMRVLTVMGKPLTDMIVWEWEADDLEVDIEVYDGRDDTVTPVTLERYLGEDWGLEFDGAVFDGMRTCVNACIFCFMNMLPKEHREALSIRDDDYRLSFLQGNFVTLTNMTDAEVDDAIDKMLSPMNVSLHAVSPDVRRRLIGRHAQRGLDVLERFLEAGIEIHAQIVLCPGLNDGDELLRTLAFCEERPGITSLAVVPLGFTKHQNRFTSSYSDDPAAARAVVEGIRPFQDRARKHYGRTVFQLGDEFYLAAGMEPPAAAFYDGYPQYYDGIGMIRSYLDETDDVLEGERDQLAAIRKRLAHKGLQLVVVSGTAARATVARFVEAPDGLAGHVIAIENRYFGGNVDVTGLICAEDVLAQLPDDLAGTLLILPSLMFNADDLTLDGSDRAALVSALEGRGARVITANTMPRELMAVL